MGLLKLKKTEEVRLLKKKNQLLSIIQKLYPKINSLVNTTKKGWRKLMIKLKRKKAGKLTKLNLFLKSTKRRT